MGNIMYEQGKKLVLRETNRERRVIIEDLVADDEGNKLRVRDLETNSMRTIDPTKMTIVEDLED
jgi:hypothetical protein